MRESFKLVGNFWGCAKLWNFCFQRLVWNLPKLSTTPDHFYTSRTEIILFANWNAKPAFFQVLAYCEEQLRIPDLSMMLQNLDSSFALHISILEDSSFWLYGSENVFKGSSRETIALQVIWQGYHELMWGLQIVFHLNFSQSFW